MPAAFSMAQKMGALLGRSSVLQRPLPEKQAEGAGCWLAKATQAANSLRCLHPVGWRLPQKKSRALLNFFSPVLIGFRKQLAAAPSIR
jgi:hypothetical protein